MTTEELEKIDCNLEVIHIMLNEMDDHSKDYIRDERLSIDLAKKGFMKLNHFVKICIAEIENARSDIFKIDKQLNDKY